MDPIVELKTNFSPMPGTFQGGFPVKIIYHKN